MIEIIFLSLLIVAAAYALIILWCISGWNVTDYFDSEASGHHTLLSVIVPARNEEKNIEACLQDIIKQNYPKELREIILVDDDSSDKTVELVQKIKEKFPHEQLQIISLKNEEKKYHKKDAITTAIKIAQGELIITTDADCRMNDNWLSTVADYYEKNNVEMIAGPVFLKARKNIFKKFQSLEFMGLIGIAAAGITRKNPVMCNGANLAYTKKIFDEVKGFESQENSASGDDTQLMLKIAAIDIDKIHFLKSRDAIVFTSASKSIAEFYNQRKRWASKIPRKLNTFTFLISSVAYVLHLGLVGFFIYSFYSTAALGHFYILFFIKCIAEILFLYDVADFFQWKRLLIWFPAAQFFYMFYVVIIGAVAPFGTYRWKERQMK